MNRRDFILRILLIFILITGLPHRVPGVDVPGGYELRRSRDGIFIIHYPARLSRMAGTIEVLLVKSAGDIALEMGHEALDTIDVYIASDERSYRRLHRGMVPEWGSAFSDLAGQVLGINAEAVLRVKRPLKTVVRHELSHLLLAQRVRGVRCPTWFMEGLAMIQSDEWSFNHQWRLVHSVWKKRLPYLDELEGAFPLPAEDASLAYALSYIGVEELFREGHPDLVTFTAAVRELGDFDEAFLSTFGESAEDFSLRLHVLTLRRYRTAGTLLQTAPYWLAVAILFLAAYAVKRFKSRRKLREWERAEIGNGDPGIK